MPRHLLLAALLLLAAPSVAQAQGSAYMVKDIKTEQGPFGLGLAFWGFSDGAELDGFGYFRGSDGIHGEELWRWSPTGGVEMVADICPGSCSSYPLAFVAVGSQVFFSAEDGSHGVELWATDGSAAGTLLMRDISSDVMLSNARPMALTRVGDRLFFTAGPDYYAQELWISDGTPGGTVPVADILLGSEGSNPRSLVEFDGLLYFTADDGDSGRELWRSDGTSRGTELVLDLCAGDASCFFDEQWVPWGARALQPLGERLLLGLGESWPEELRSLHPTTLAVESLASDISSVFTPYPLLGGFAYFNGCEVSSGFRDCELWRTDGSAAGTERVKDIRAGNESSGPFMLGGLSDKVLFYASHDGEGGELWRSDGTEAGTARVRDIYPGPESSRYLSALPGTRLGDQLVFTAWDGVRGIELWATDGTEAGTFMLADANPGPGSAFVDYYLPQLPVEVDGFLGYQAIDQQAGFRFWQTDGTSEGTELVGDLDLQASSVSQGTLFGPTLRSGARGGGLLFTAANDEDGYELWSSDGTEAGTRLVADLAPGEDGAGVPYSSRPLNFAGQVSPAFVSTTEGVFATDGTTAGTVGLVSEANGSPFAFLPAVSPEGDMTEVFFAADGTLFVSDGTPLGTEALADEVYGELLRVGETFLFARDGRAVWRTEGSEETTEYVSTPNGGDYAEIEFLATVGGYGLFAALEEGSGNELWRSDTTTAGTTRVADIRPGPQGSEPGYLSYGASAAVTSRGIYFTADDGTSGRELWVSNGEPVGTYRVADVWPGELGSNPSDVVAVGERVFFFADDGKRGRELWVVDGSSHGARLVRDVNRGAGSSTPIRRLGTRMLAVGERVYFSATDGERGAELWTSDGTAQGTYMLQDINPGPGSATPENFVLAGDCVYFSANDGEHGFELWALPLSSTSLAGCEAIDAKTARSIFDR